VRNGHTKTTNLKERERKRKEYYSKRDGIRASGLLLALARDIKEV
jgi:hypothetical protein